MAKYRRRIKLIRPKLQLKLVGVFVGLAALSLALQYFVFLAQLTAAASELPNDGGLLLERAGPLLSRIFLWSCAGCLPLIAWIGVLVTHRVAGPVYRLETWLASVARGERPADCKLRKGDELEELCAAVNQATLPLRQGGAATGAQASERRAA